MKKYKVILISGGFDPVHKGHIQCIQNAKKLADQIWIVTGKQLFKKSHL